MLLGFILNISKIAIDLISLAPNPQVVNYILIGLIAVLVPVSIKWPEKIKYTLAIANISTGLLQMNFPQGTLPQHYYDYGSNFMQFQVCSYFVSDFQNSLAQLFFHTCIKLGITIYYTGQTDIMDILMSIFAPIALSVVIYVCDSNSRQQFLQNIKEDIWIKQLPDLIRQPFFEINYNKTMLQFQVRNFSGLNSFPGFSEELCEGCNVRNLLRLYKEGTLTLEQALLGNCSESLEIIYQGYKFGLRLCSYGIEKINFIVIMDSIVQKFQSRSLPLMIKKMTNYLIHHSSRNEKVQLFNWGVISMLLVNDSTIGDIDLFEMLCKLKEKFSRNGRVQFVIEDQEKLKFSSYINLIRIYLIQLYQTLIVLSDWQLKINKKTGNKSNSIIKLCILHQAEVITLQLPKCLNSFLFQSKYQNNIFINQVEHIILRTPLTSDLQIHFNKLLPFI